MAKIPTPDLNELLSSLAAAPDPIEKAMAKQPAEAEEPTAPSAAEYKAACDELNELAGNGAQPHELEAKRREIAALAAKMSEEESL